MRPARPLVAVLGGAQTRREGRRRASFSRVGRRRLPRRCGCASHSLPRWDTASGDRCARCEDVGRRGGARCGGRVRRSARASRGSELVRWGPRRGSRDATRSTGSTYPTGGWASTSGPAPRARYAESIAAAATVFWNGPMGRFELPQFAAGTRAGRPRRRFDVRDDRRRGRRDRGGAVGRFGLEERVNHLSTGGQAMLEFLEGRELPGVEVLRPHGARSGAGGRRAGPRTEWPRRAPNPYAGAFRPRLSFAFSWSSFASTAALSCSRWLWEAPCGLPTWLYAPRPPPRRSRPRRRRTDRRRTVPPRSDMAASITSGFSSLTTAGSAVLPRSGASLRSDRTPCGSRPTRARRRLLRT